MAGFFRNPQLEARKAVLVAEAEIYRQTLRLELYNVRIYTDSLKSKLSIFSLLGPLMMIGAPVAGAVLRFRKAKSSSWGLLSRLFQGWQLYRRFSPVLRVFLSQRLRRGSGRSAAESQSSFRK